MKDPLKVFLSYSPENEDLRKELENHLTVLKRKKIVEVWHEGWIVGGTDRDATIQSELEKADLCLLLVSSDFLASNACWNHVMLRAIERHKAGTARVVPILLRPCDWRSAPFGELQALPRDGRPVTSWQNQDEAFLDIALGLRDLLDSMDSIRYPDERTRTLSQALDEVYERREELLRHSKDTTSLDEEILVLRREIREGGQLRPGDRLFDGRFKLVAKIGQGGFATVWKAIDRRHRKPRLVAIKVLHGQFAHDRTRRERFFRGARQMARLRHPSIAEIVEEELEDGGYYFFAMEYVPEGDFHRRVLAGELNLEQKIEAILAVGEALQYAHRKKVIHRDVKPQNILLDGSNHPKLTDFDLVHAAETTGGTRTGMMGTVVFAAPEMMERAKDAEFSADIYGLAMSAVFALHGHPIPASVLRDIPGFVSRLNAPPALRRVLLKAVAWEPENRFSSMKAFCQALRQTSLPAPKGNSPKPPQPAQHLESPHPNPARDHTSPILPTQKMETTPPPTPSTQHFRPPVEKGRTKRVKKPIDIRVIGLGGAGVNAVNRMIDSSVQGIEFVSAHTDLQALRRSKSTTKLQLGENLFRGLGTAGNADSGRKSAFEDPYKILKSLEGADIVFIACGMGGGTGTGSAPVIASYAEQLGALTIAVVTKPFHFEGRRRMALAEQGLEDLRRSVDVLIVIPNERLLSFVERGTPLTEAFRIADDVLRQAIQGISDLITVPGKIDVGLADIKAIMTGAGKALMGTGIAKGENRAHEATQRAISSPLLEETSIEDAKGVLLNISGGPNMTLHEVSEAVRIISEAVDPEAYIISGMVIDEDLEDEVKVTVIATRFDRATPQEDPPSTDDGTTEQAQNTPDSVGEKSRPEQAEAPENYGPNWANIDDYDIPTVLRKPLDKT